MNTSILNLSAWALLSAQLLIAYPTSAAEAIELRVAQFPSYVSGAAGFSFVPDRDLEMTRVGYLDISDPLGPPIISLWSNTTLTASLEMPSGTFGQMVYRDYAYALDAGHRYSITLQNGPLSGSIVIAEVSQGRGTAFIVAPELTNYSAHTVTPAGVFAEFDPNLFYRGANFSFRVLGPRLRIFRTRTNSVVVAWPNPSTGFLLEMKSDLRSLTWSPAPNPINIVGSEKHVIISPPIGNRFYRLKQ